MLVRLLKPRLAVLTFAVSNQVLTSDCKDENASVIKTDGSECLRALETGLKSLEITTVPKESLRFDTDVIGFETDGNYENTRNRTCLSTREIRTKLSSAKFDIERIYEVLIELLQTKEFYLTVNDSVQEGEEFLRRIEDILTEISEHLV